MNSPVGRRYGAGSKERLRPVTTHRRWLTTTKLYGKGRRAALMLKLNGQSPLRSPRPSNRPERADAPEAPQPQAACTRG